MHQQLANKQIHPFTALRLGTQTRRCQLVIYVTAFLLS